MFRAGFHLLLLHAFETLVRYLESMRLASSRCGMGRVRSEVDRVATAEPLSAFGPGVDCWI